MNAEILKQVWENWGTYDEPEWVMVYQEIKTIDKNNHYKRITQSVMKERWEKA
jgi:hypothetical protein